jgi:hypothetical protein
VTVCPAGHNLAVHGRVNPSGSRNCAVCERRAARQFRARQRVLRPRPWAVVWWVPNKRAGEINARWSYHPTAEHAQRAAPTDGQPFTVVNIGREPSVVFPNVELLIRRSRALAEQFTDGGRTT